MLISAPRDQVVDTIRQRTDIVELVSRYVKLKKAGSNLVGLCPFHAEKTPSFTVSPRKGFFHCFGCKASGDVYSFLMRMEGKTFPEVLEELAARSGVSLPARKPADRQSRDMTQRLLEINEVAATWYQRELWSNGTGNRAREYLNRRGLKEDIAQTFRVGYAPSGWHKLGDHLGKMGTSLEDATSLGLLGKGSRGFYDVFRDRLMFPILGLDGKVRGFGGRKLDPNEEGPKYINSRQSRLFDKSEMLYGLHQARTSIQSSDEAILVEGYFDGLSLVAAGIKNVVATCGTAFTEAHARVLKRFCEKIITVFDADLAGMTASFRSAQVLLGEGLSAYMVMLPAGEDPDSFVQARGGEIFRELIAGAKPTIEVLTDSSLKQAGDDVEARAKALRELIPLLAACSDSLRLGNYLRLVAERFAVDEKDIRQAVYEQRRLQRSGYPDEAARSAAANDAASQYPEEETYVALLLRFPQLVAKVVNGGVMDSFNSEPLRKLVGRLVDADAFESVALFLAGVEDQGLQSRLSGKVMDDSAFPEDKAERLLQECMLKIRRRHLKTKLRQLTARIGQAVKAGLTEEKERLQRDKIRLNQELSALRVPTEKRRES